MRSPVSPATALIAALFAATPLVASAQEERADWLDIEVGKSVVLETPRVPTAIAITDPNVVNVESLGEASKIQVQGIAIGTTDLIVQFGPGIPPMIYELTVHRDMSDLIRRIDAIVEGEPPRVFPLGERIVIEGEVDDLDTLEQVALVARIYDSDFVNLMQVRGDHQVQLEVLFAEVSRSGTRDLGLNLLYGNSTLAAGLIAPGTSTVAVQNSAIQSISAGAGNGGIAGPVTGAYQIAGFASQIDLSGVISVLDDFSLGKILAQPTLVSLSGQQADFLAGGEVPIPQARGGGGANAISVQFREFGVRLAFVPTVLANDVIDVRMDLEISEPDYAIGTRVTGIEIPGFISRKSRSHLRIESGMTFAVAGMISERSSFSRAGIPGLGRIPILGMFFRRVHHVRSENEVVIYVTPRLVRPLAPGEIPAPPGSTENNNPSDFELFLLGMNHRPGSRTAQPTGAVGLQR
ncbi:MAG: pilus assembly protein CpaC [Myxococcota bacterium]|jgi:pilus assembly protein CpaC